jgi:CheY-like chemotaxis protein
MASLKPDSSEPPPRTILVVEDEVLIRLSLSDYLRECGFTVLEAASGDEAIAVLRGRGDDVDLVFSDVQMPGETDGFALARWVRGHHPRIPVMLTSGVAHAVEKAADLCLEGPIVKKPYDHATLLSQILRLVERARQNS